MSAPETEILIYKEGEQIARHVVKPGEYVIGREPGCDIIVLADAVSRKHAQLTINYDHALVEDLGSSNGTSVAGRRISECTRLFPNQVIQIGSATIQLRRIKSDAPSDPLTPHSAAVKRYLPPDFLHERKYDIGGVIAQGGMGSILDAQEKLLRRKVAMKIMTSTGTQEKLVRFLEEAQITGQLEHPNIVPVYELGVDEQEEVFYTMKLVRGVTLQHVLTQIAEGSQETVAKYPLAELLTIFQKVCDALAFAHSKGVVHRDLKPENVMLGEFGEVLVMDWGLARATARSQAADSEPARTLVRSSRQDEGEAMMTMAGMVFGTPQYMAPEQARGQTDRLDARTDIYSLGGILYHILTLEPPIGGEDVGQILQSVASGQVAEHVAARGPKAVHSQRALAHLPGGKVPEPLAALTRKAMALNQEDRYQTVKELQTAVGQFQAGLQKAVAQGAALAAPVKGKLLPVGIILSVVIVLLMAVVAKLALDRSRAEAALRDALKAAPLPGATAAPK